MKATELRIGNLLQDKESKTLLEVIELTKSNIITYVIDRSKYPLKQRWNLEPVLLTKEWLIKFGFKYKPCGISGCDMWQGMGFWTCTQLQDLILRGDVKFGLKIYPFGNSRVKYVHELQNLFHTLTGEELKTT